MNTYENQYIEEDNGEYMSKFSKEIFDWMESIVFALAIVVILFSFVSRIVRVEGDSMVPTLLDHDRVLVSNLFYKPKAGDIVVITQENRHNAPLIKRVIATEGQTVDIDTESGLVYVDGVALDEPYTSDLTYNAGNAYTYPLVVEENMLFCLGDNRPISSDSRDSGVGMINEDNIMGKAVLRIFPFSSFGGIYDYE